MNQQSQKTPPPLRERELWEELLDKTILYFWTLLSTQPLKFALWLITAILLGLIIRHTWLTDYPPLGPNVYLTPQQDTARQEMLHRLVIGTIIGLMIWATTLLILCRIVRTGPLAWRWGDLLPVGRWLAARRQRKLPPPPPLFEVGDLVVGIPYTPRDEAHWQDQGQWDETLAPNQVFRLTKAEARLNTLIVAPQNTGKTTLMRDYVRWCLWHGYSAIVTDPKGDDYADEARSATHRIDLAAPATSHKLCIWSPLATTPAKKAEILAEAILSASRV